MVGNSTIFAVLLVTLSICNDTQCENKCKPKDCVDLRGYGVSTGRDGPHTVYPGISALPNTLDVSCDQITAGGGWTLWMRRSQVTNDTDFNQTWRVFKDGFGRQNGPDSEFYLGNEIVHQITANYPGKNGELRIEGVSRAGSSMATAASMFSLGDEASRYTMHVGVEHVHENTPNNELRYYDNRPFSQGDEVCRKQFDHVYWWFDRCTTFFFFGIIRNPKMGNRYDYTAMAMLTAIQRRVALKRAIMMFRPFKDIRVSNNPCKNKGTCEYVAADDTNRCICKNPYCGSKCEMKCENGGTCHANKAGLPSCKCPVGFSGQTCSKKNVCEKPCMNSGTCGYDVANDTNRCICTNPYCGSSCEMICENGGTCQANKAGLPSCKCPVGFSDQTCSKKNVCEKPCMNSGTCEYDVANDTNRCICTNPYCGSSCEMICENGGTCQYNKVWPSACKCADGYSGPYCQKKNETTTTKELSVSEKKNTIWFPYLLLLLLTATIPCCISFYIYKKRHNAEEQERERQLLLEKELEENTGCFSSVLGIPDAF